MSSECVLYRMCSLQNVFSIDRHETAAEAVSMSPSLSIENTFCREHIL